MLISQHQAGKLLRLDTHMEIGTATIGLLGMVNMELVLKPFQTFRPEITHSSTNGVQMVETFKAAQALVLSHFITKFPRLIGPPIHNSISLKFHSK